MELKFYNQSNKLNDVCYDIRGPVMDEAERMEALGSKILKLNIGNPAPFGFSAPDEVLLDLIYNPARTALLLQAEELGIPGENGLYMLVAQAKAAAELFLGRAIPESETGRVAGLMAERVGQEGRKIGENTRD